MTERALFNLYDVCSTKSIRMQRYETAADKGILRLGRQGSPTDRIRRLASTAEPGFPRQSRRRIDRELFASRKQQHGAQPERTADPARLSEPGLRIVGVAGQEESSYCRFPVQAVQQIEQSGAGAQQNIQLPPWHCAAFHRKLTIMIPNTTASRIMPKESGSRGFFSAKGNGCFPASSSGVLPLSSW